MGSSSQLNLIHKLLLEQNQYNTLLQKQTDMANQMQMQTLTNRLQQNELAQQMQLSQLANQMGQQNITTQLFTMATKGSAPQLPPPPPPPTPPPPPPPVIVQQSSQAPAHPGHGPVILQQQDKVTQFPGDYGPDDDEDIYAPVIPIGTGTGTQCSAPTKRGSTRRTSGPVANDPNLCPYCGNGVFHKKTTVTGYLTAVICFPCGLYCCLAKKCCYIVECSYCHAVSKRDPVKVRK